MRDGRVLASRPGIVRWSVEITPRPKAARSSCSPRNPIPRHTPLHVCGDEHRVKQQHHRQRDDCTPASLAAPAVAGAAGAGMDVGDVMSPPEYRYFSIQQVFAPFSTVKKLAIAAHSMNLASTPFDEKQTRKAKSRPAPRRTHLHLPAAWTRPSTARSPLAAPRCRYS